MSSIAAAATPAISAWVATLGAHPFLTALSVLGLGLTYLIVSRIYFELTFSYRNLPGPKSSGPIFGNLAEFTKSMPATVQREWMDQHGVDTVMYRGLFNEPRICTRDLTAITYILQHSEYGVSKPAFLANMLGKATAPDGLLVTEGHVHHRQRRVLNPAFGPASVKGMDSIFFDKGYELRDKILSILHGESSEVPSPTPPQPGDEAKGGRKMDISKYLAHCTLDVIGLAGFDYDFHALSQANNELAHVIFLIFSEGQQLTMSNILYNFFPWLGHFYTTKQRKTVINGAKTLNVYSREFVARKKREVMAEVSGKLEKGSIVGRDLLTLLIRANMAPDLREDQKLSDQEVVAQIITFILAGNETSSTALTWILYRLAQNPDMQKRLRTELQTIDADRPDQDTLNALPYMEKVIREGLRFDNPVAGTERCTNEEMVIPLATPITGRDGKLMDHVVVPKGTDIGLNIMSVNHSKDIWGDDAERFNPDRFDRPGIPMQHVPGVYGNLLTFLGGAHNCIGWRFAMAEIKALLFIIVRNFQFEILASQPVVEPKTVIVMRPRIVGEEEVGLQMPLLVREYIEE